MAISFDFLDSNLPMWLAAWNVPGAAVAVVKDDEVVLARGYGQREAGKPGDVDEHTLFAVASNTKAFTATAIGMLVSEGKLGWDDPVTQYLPAFQMYDPIATREITIRDLLCHRSGLGTWAGDWIWYGSSYSAAEMVQRMRYIEPAFRLGAGYGYCNLAFLVAGQVLTAVTGQPWEDFIRERFFAPLGMSRSLASVREFVGQENIATPHQVFNGQLCAIPYRVADNCAPGGSINSSAWDMAQWLRLQLGMGRFNGSQLVDEAIIEETHTPQNLLRIPPDLKRINPSRHFSAYGLGWFLGDNRGRFVVTHGGALDGMQSFTGLLPEEQAGIVILTNRLPHSLPAVIFQVFVDALTGAPQTDWNAAFKELDDKTTAEAAEKRRQAKEARAIGTHASMSLASYTGLYSHPAYGELTVVEEGGHLALRPGAHPQLSGILEHWQYDTFLCRWSDPVYDQCLVPFHLDAAGKVESFSVRVDPGIDPLEYVFKRVSK